MITAFTSELYLVVVLERTRTVENTLDFTWGDLQCAATNFFRAGLLLKFASSFIKAL